MKRRRLGAAALCLAALAPIAAGCGTYGSNLPVTEATARIGTGGLQVVEIGLHSYYFKPSRVVVMAGAPVELALHSENYIVPHNFTCVAPEAGIQVSVNVKFHKTKRVRFTPTKAGEYPFYCHVGSHAKKGMKGTLVVR